MVLVDMSRVLPPRPRSVKRTPATSAKGIHAPLATSVFLISRASSTNRGVSPTSS